MTLNGNQFPKVLKEKACKAGLLTMDGLILFSTWMYEKSAFIYEWQHRHPAFQTSLEKVLHHLL